MNLVLIGKTFIKSVIKKVIVSDYYYYLKDQPWL